MASPIATPCPPMNFVREWTTICGAKSKPGQGSLVLDNGPVNLCQARPFVLYVQ
jgi:hypothetical protein